jgi:hypothetical protein
MFLIRIRNIIVILEYNLSMVTYEVVVILIELTLFCIFKIFKYLSKIGPFKEINAHVAHFTRRKDYKNHLRWVGKLL